MPANPSAGITMPSGRAINPERLLSLVDVRNFQTCASIKKSEAEDAGWDCQVRSGVDCRGTKVRYRLKTRPTQAMLREINFSSKLVKVTEDDMKEKPKRTRNWKGRRAAERDKLNRTRGPLFESEPLAPPRCHPEPPSPSQWPPDALPQDANAEENFSEFLTSLGGVPDIEEYFRWALPLSPKASLDAATAGQVDVVKEQSKRSCGCGAEGMGRDSGARGPGDGAQDGGPEEEVRGPVCWRVCFGMFIASVVESERLKRQEDEVLRKIEGFLRRNGKMEDEKMKTTKAEETK